MRNLSSRFGIFLSCCLFLLYTNAYAESEDSFEPTIVNVDEQGEQTPEEQTEEVVEIEEEDSEHSFIVGTLLYIPNRVLDMLDIFRLRVRVGPGLAAGVRATKVAQIYAGTYVSAYVGLPGPRMRKVPKSPVGLESHNGVTASIADATVDGGIGPDYSPTEIGTGVQLAIIGFDFGIDPYEIVDFVTGIVTIDLREDDL
jgi:hypothetical protein